MVDKAALSVPSTYCLDVLVMLHIHVCIACAVHKTACHYALLSLPSPDNSKEEADPDNSKEEADHDDSKEDAEAAPAVGGTPTRRSSRVQKNLADEEKAQQRQRRKTKHENIWNGGTGKPSKTSSKTSKPAKKKSSKTPPEVDNEDGGSDDFFSPSEDEHNGAHQPPCHYINTPRVAQFPSQKNALPIEFPSIGTGGLLATELLHTRGS